MRNIEKLCLAIASISSIAGVMSFNASNAETPKPKDYQVINHAEQEIIGIESAMGRYFASLNVKDPQAGIDAALAYCKNPTPVEQQANANYLCNTLVPKRESFIDDKVRAETIILEKKADANRLMYGMFFSLAIAGATLVTGILTKQKPNRNYKTEPAHS